MAAVERAISAAGHIIVEMADFPAADQPPAQLCRDLVRGCDVYVGILGTRYGSPVRDKQDVSYTELEFETAAEASLERLVFLLDTTAEDVKIPPVALIDLEFGARQEAFRRRVQASGVVTQKFTDPATLGQLVERSLRELAERRRRLISGSLRGQVSADRCDIALLTAVPIETKALFEVLRERGLSSRSVQRGGRYFDVFELPSQAGKPRTVVITQATGKGGQSASAVTHDVIAGFRPRLVLVVGVCGGFVERKVALNDVILARNIYSYDSKRVQPDGVGGRPLVYRTDEQLLRLASYLDNRGDLKAELRGNRLHIKDYVSGEKVLAWREAKLRAELLRLSVDVYGVDTEEHGVMHAIWETFKADLFVGGGLIKCVSDLGDEEMGVDKDTKQFVAAQKAAHLALDIVAAFRRE